MVRLEIPLASKVSNVQVGDGTDGKLVHLDGLNFSRAWGLYRIASRLGGEEGERLVHRPTQFICICDIYLSTDKYKKYKRHSRAIC